jgi:hypothetical protein
VLLSGSPRHLTTSGRHARDAGDLQQMTIYGFYEPADGAGTASAS